jgi:hypothetical protein
MDDIQGGRYRLRRVPAEQKRYFEGVEMGDDWREEEERKKLQRAARQEKIDRHAYIQQSLVSIEGKVRMRLFAMAGTEARSIRSKNLINQMVDGLKLTDEEYLEHDVLSWFQRLLVSLQAPEGAELEVSKPISEESFVKVHDHYNAVMNNRRIVNCNNGSLLSRIASLRSASEAKERLKAAAEMTALNIVDPSTCESVRSAVGVGCLYTGVLSAAIGKCVGSPVPTEAVGGADVVVHGVVENIVSLAKCTVSRATAAGTKPLLLGVGAGLIATGLYSTFSSNFYGKVWRDIKSGD